MHPHITSCNPCKHLLLSAAASSYAVALWEQLLLSCSVAFGEGVTHQFSVSAKIFSTRLRNLNQQHNMYRLGGYTRHSESKDPSLRPIGQLSICKPWILAPPHRLHFIATDVASWYLSRQYDLLRNLMGSLSTHATPFHQVSRKLGE